MSLSTLHQPAEAMRDTPHTWVERMPWVEVPADGSGTPFLPTRPEDCVDTRDFVRRLSPDVQRILSEHPP